MSRLGYWYVLSDAERRRGQDSGSEDPAYIEGWGLPTWRDEFDYIDPGTSQPMVDPAKWNVRQRAGDLGLLNDASVVEKSQITVDSNGICHIKGEWLDTPVVTTTGPAGNPTNRWHKTGYMDHRIVNGGDIAPYTQQWGIWEIRMSCAMKYRESMGTDGAFWLRNGSTGEIDIVEFWGSGPTSVPANSLHPTQPKPNEGRPTLTFHTQTNNDALNIKTPYTLSRVDDEWHTWRFVYTPNLMQMWMDSTKLVEETPATKPVIFTDTAFTSSPWHIRYNLHIGPSTQYYGLPDPDHHEWTSDPQDFQIDYIRAYEYQP